MTMIRPHIGQLAAYETGAKPEFEDSAVKLNLNENPYPPSPLVLAMLNRITETAYRRYPDAKCQELCEALAAHHGVRPEQTFCANGSSEIISLVFKAFVGENGRCAIPDPSFSLYQSVAAIEQAKCVLVPTDADFSIDIDTLIASECDTIVLVNPNAPTGKLLPLAEIERMITSFPGLVVLDEAYMDFSESDESAIPLVKRYANLLVVRTFSKAYALCGMRVGYCIGDERLIEALEKTKVIYNVNAMSRQFAIAALRDQAYLAKTVEAIRRTRDVYSEKLREVGFGVVPSQTNFLLCTPPMDLGENTARKLYEQLMERNIYVRHFNHPRLSDKLRISIGTDEEMEILIAHQRDLLNCTQ